VRLIYAKSLCEQESMQGVTVFNASPGIKKTRIRQSVTRHLWFAIIWLFLLDAVTLVFAAEETAESGRVENANAASHTPHAMYFAKVNGKEISLKEYQSAFNAGAGKRFYHGKIPDAELLAFKKEISQTLVDRVLLLEEAQRLAIPADEKFVKAKLADYEKRYSGRAFWEKNKNTILPGLTTALEEQSMLAALENKIRGVALPDIAQAKDFYDKNPALFTTPEKLRVSLILLKVEPSSPAAVWDAAREEALEIIARLKKGADFSQLARIHSGDASASKGGDMGFLHKGMLAKPAQLAIDEMTAGQVSEPIMMLRGVAIIRLEEKEPASLNAFENVVERAQKLLQRENAKFAWSDLLEKLRSAADITINTVALGIDRKV